MINFYSGYKAKIQTMLGKKVWVKALTRTRSDWLSSFLNRRLLHRFCLQAENKKTLDSISMHSGNLDSVLKVVHHATQHVTPGKVVVQGDMTQMKISDWLHLDLLLIKEQLNSETVFDVSNHALTAFMARRAYMPAALRDYKPLWLKALVGMPGCFLDMLAMFSVYHASLHYSFGLLATTAMFCGLFVWLLAHVGLAINSCRYQYDAFEDHMLPFISTTWDDVFEMRSAEDAILLGLVSGVIHKAQQEDANVSIPNFLAMAPSQAFKILVRSLRNDGMITGVKAIDAFNTLGLTSNKEIARQSTSTVAGYDFSVLVAPDAAPVIVTNTEK